jgi:hypothetical protein
MFPFVGSANRYGAAADKIFGAVPGRDGGQSLRLGARARDQPQVRTPLVARAGPAAPCVSPGYSPLKSVQS